MPNGRLFTATISTRALAPPAVKQHLAAIRMLFDWLVVGQVMRLNPASSVRGPKHVVKRGKTPVLSAEDARRLLDSIPPTRKDPGHEQDRVPDLVGLRDRAFIGVMVFSFARVGTVCGMKVEDYYQDGKRCWFRLHEKGGRFHEVPDQRGRDRQHPTRRRAGVNRVEHQRCITRVVEVEDDPGVVFESSAGGQSRLGTDQVSDAAFPAVASG